MHRTILTLALALTAASAACDRGTHKAADTALNTDLSLAAQQRGFQPLDSITAAERAAAGHTSTAAGDVARTRRTAATNTSRTTTTTTTRTSGGTVVKHTKRDAAIGAAAGAVIGATTSRDKVKGGLIGAAIGGIIGGVIGNNVDKKKKP